MNQVKEIVDLVFHIERLYALMNIVITEAKVPLSQELIDEINANAFNTIKNKFPEMNFEYKPIAAETKE